MPVAAVIAEATVELEQQQLPIWENPQVLYLAFPLYWLFCVYKFQRLNTYLKRQESKARAAQRELDGVVFSFYTWAAGQADLVLISLSVISHFTDGLDPMCWIMLSVVGRIIQNVCVDYEVLSQTSQKRNHDLIIGFKIISAAYITVFLWATWRLTLSVGLQLTWIVIFFVYEFLLRGLISFYQSRFKEIDRFYLNSVLHAVENAMGLTVFCVAATFFFMPSTPLAHILSMSFWRLALDPVDRLRAAMDKRKASVAVPKPIFLEPASKFQYAKPTVSEAEEVSGEMIFGRPIHLVYTKEPHDNPYVHKLLGSRTPSPTSSGHATAGCEDNSAECDGIPDDTGASGVVCVM